MFEAIMFMLFGKRWVKYQMLTGLKGAIFVNEMEVAMDKEKYNKAVAAKEQLEKDYAALLETPLTDPKELLSEEDLKSEKMVYDIRKKLEAERKEAVEAFKVKIKEATSEVSVAEANMDRTYGISYSNRRKFDFIRGYKIVPTYADKK